MIPLVVPNLDITARAGMCLEHTRRVFGAPVVEASAWEGWERVRFRHADRNLPGVPVPLWFTHYGTYGAPPVYKNWGHVVTFVPGRGLLSSPGVGVGSQWFGSIEEVERYFNAKYVGWSEDISGVRVARPQETGVIVQNTDAWFARFKKAMEDSRGSERASKVTRAELLPFVGNDSLHMFEAVSDNPERDQNVRDADLGRLARRDNWEGQIYSLRDQVKALSDRPTGEELAALQAKVDELASSAAQARARVAQLEAQNASDTEAADTLLRRVGQWIKKYVLGGKE